MFPHWSMAVYVRSYVTTLATVEITASMDDQDAFKSHASSMTTNGSGRVSPSASLTSIHANGKEINTGARVSNTVITWIASAVFPASSLAVNVLVHT